jgi:hypothetical protein
LDLRVVGRATSLPGRPARFELWVEGHQWGGGSGDGHGRSGTR